jgi:hypothetical protein
LRSLVEDGGIMVVERTAQGPRWGRFTAARLDELRSVGDPVADGPVAAVLEDGTADRVSALLHSLIRDGDPAPAGLPAPIDDYLFSTLALPDWADGDRIERAQRFFELWGVQISVCLFCASLPSAYACANGVQVLHLTARLDTDTRRRVMETGQFLMDVMAPGSLAADGSGVRVIQRVRLMHGAIRHLVAARAVVQPSVWDPAWGQPINQEDLAGTLLSFGYVPADPLRRLGVDVTDRDAEDYLHCWNVIGHQLGVCDELLTTDVADATDLVTAIRSRQLAASPEGADLARALVELLESMTPGHRADRFVPALIRHLSGEEIADVLDVPPGHVAGRVPRWLGRIIGAVESAVERDGALARLAEPFGRELLAAAFCLERGGTRAPFAIPTALATRWGIDAADAPGSVEATPRTT